jgi:hypothetical protein
MNRPISPMAGSALDHLLRSDLARLLDRIAALPDVDPSAGMLDPEGRARIEEAEARLAAVRLRLLAGYEEWKRALEHCGDLWALSGLRAGAGGGAPDRRAA